MPRRGGLTTTRSGGRAAERVRRRVAGLEPHVRRARPRRALRSALATASRAGLDAGDRRGPGRAQVQREPADPAVQVPHRARRELVRPRPRLRGTARPRPRCWSGRSSAAAGAGRAPLTRIGSVSCSVSRISRSPSRTALCSGCRLTETTTQRGQRREQPRQVLADPGHRLLGAQHEPHHQLAVGRLRDQQVLQLAAPGRHVVRRERGAGDELGEHRAAPRGCAGVCSAAVAQVDAGAARVEDAERRAPRPSRRRPSWPCCGSPTRALATGGSHARPSHVAEQLRGVRCFSASCSSYGCPSSVHERHRPASKWEQGMTRQGYG